MTDFSKCTHQGMNLENQNLRKIPPRYSHSSIIGNCDLRHNLLTSLRNSPHEVEGSFSCSNNQLISLEYGPVHVGSMNDMGTYSCDTNKLVTLKGAPNTIFGDFECFDNNLTTLEFGPKAVHGSYFCNSNKLTTLEHLPLATYAISCGNNPVETLCDIHKIVTNVFKINFTNYKNENDSRIDAFEIFNPKSGGIGLIFIKNLREVIFNGGEDTDLGRALIIIRRYLGKGKEGLLSCSSELCDAGLDEYARL